MSSQKSKIQSGELEDKDNGNIGRTKMDLPSDSKTETELNLSKIPEISPRTDRSGASSSEVFSSPIGIIRDHIPRLKPNLKLSTPRTPLSQRFPPPLSTTLSSSIPLYVRTPSSISRLSPSAAKTSTSTTIKPMNKTSSIASRSIRFASKHTLEVQFINKHKRFNELKNELIEKQRPFLNLYQSLSQIKKKLDELGKNVKLDEIKIVSFEEYKNPIPSNVGSGEEVSMEIVNEMKLSIEEIPKTLMDICKNLLSRRALIVELLESVTKSEIDVEQVSDKIESLKSEGAQLQQSLEGVIEQHETKINDLVKNWQKLLADKQEINISTKIEDLEGKLKDEERLRAESTTLIHDLHKKLDDRKLIYEKGMAELNGVLHSLREQVRKLEQDLDAERKVSSDYKSRSSSNNQTIKTMRTKICELENEKEHMKTSNTELQRKIKEINEKLREKEMNWAQEKDEMNKSLKHQEHLLQKVTADKNQFETRLEKLIEDQNSTEASLKSTLASLHKQLEVTNNQLKEVKTERDDAVMQCTKFEKYISRIGEDFKEELITANTLIADQNNKEKNYIAIAKGKDDRIKELESKIGEIVRQKEIQKTFEKKMKDEPKPTELQKELESQRARIQEYESLLAESERKLQQKSYELDHLRSDIRHLKLRHEALEEQNRRCDFKELQKLVDEGKLKLGQLMKRFIESENQVEDKKKVIEKQTKQLNEMENLLRYRENIANVLKASRNDLIADKEGLTRYSKEMRVAVIEMTKELNVNNTMLESLQEKISVREAQVRNYEKEVALFEEKLQLANTKRNKLEETVEMLQRELQKVQKRLEQSTSEERSLPWRLLDSVYEVMEDKKPNKNDFHYNNRLKHDEVINNPVYSNERKNFRNRRRKVHKYSPNTSSNVSSYQNIQYTDNSSSAHTNCHHRANSRSLISLSLQTVDFIKNKLDYLSSINSPIMENHETTHQTVSIEQNTQINHLPDSNNNNNNNKNLNKILQLTAHRYEYHQNQAQESYDDLSNLVKLAVTKTSEIHK